MSEKVSEQARQLQEEWGLSHIFTRKLDDSFKQARAEVLAAFIKMADDWCRLSDEEFVEKYKVHSVRLAIYKLQPAASDLKEHDQRVRVEALARHTAAVSDFLNELYAVMVDPLAEGVISVKEMKRALLEAAIRDRQAEADREASLRQAELKLRESLRWHILHNHHAEAPCQATCHNFVNAERIAELEKARANLEKI